ncbi:single-stranded-DNA-specific exonuclease RecJ [Eubacterium sp. AF15-50]|uniref:single-stranded-DNA-specific exonuclease RecJ n=1 Tax=unclassified Eubacterium (in: firmicutes) TaxID=2624479 RepID=UPI000E4D59E3|nr:MULTISPECIES: single-stranded-DNA-specific exonuclease RecJ [unclassified Eubacterium (in: firmicutes)]RHR74275.1 single-stranded-DNA-specific exonuclease RecJ [Eubacterium sp. AF16-48]RHR81809.1 single-stranded-DNA-specific exonuclease RecJ [Eubacterium sp. AF15-50]
MKEKWFLQTKRADFNHISEKFHISPVIARIIRNRDVICDEDIYNYLNDDLEKISSPWLFKDMDKAVDILRIKISHESKIRIICDYDVDGITSGYILFRSLKKLGANIDLVVPHRIEDGYGINEKLIKNAYDSGIDTILTCDNGISAYNQVEYAKSFGMNIIITDHHEVPFEETDGKREYIVPNADAVVNHKQADCPYPFKELCGAMVAYQLISALFETEGIGKNELYKLLPYAAIATVCDVVDLKGENRIIVKQGIKKLKDCNDIGINALINACKLDKNNLSSYQFGFVIGPCLNASGRLDTAKRATELLDCIDTQKAEVLAKELVELNAERKDMTNEGAMTAIEMAQDMDDKVLVLYLKDCHESIAGIIAGRVREKYNKPTFVLTDAEQGVKGSGRSIEEYDMYSELTKVKSLLTKFGGHKMAAGISLEEKNIDLFRKMLNENCNLTEEDLYLKVWIDIALPLEYITMDFVNQLEVIKPYGKGNEKPVFAEKNLKIISLQILGKSGNVIKMVVENQNHYRMTAVKFNSAVDFMAFLSEKFGEEEVNKALQGQKNNLKIMATYYPEINEYNGRINLQIIIDRFC